MSSHFSFTITISLSYVCTFSLTWPSTICVLESLRLPLCLFRSRLAVLDCRLKFRHLELSKGCEREPRRVGRCNWPHQILVGWLSSEASGDENFICGALTSNANTRVPYNRDFTSRDTRGKYKIHEKRAKPFMINQEAVNVNPGLQAVLVLY